MGMSYREYWEEDCALVIAYRKAERLKMENFNQQAWLQGLYFYHALSDVAPILHAFANRGTTARPYPDKAFALDNTESPKRDVEKQGITEGDTRALAELQAFAIRRNRYLAENKEG